MLSAVEIYGYFTNHSLHRSGCTQLFQAGIDRKLIKEVKGHCSDAVDKYEITSVSQRQELSYVLAGNEVIEKVNDDDDKEGFGETKKEIEDVSCNF